VGHAFVPRSSRLILAACMTSSLWAPEPLAAFSPRA
jgi:hypothetical protein